MNNIYKVVNEADLNEILGDNLMKLVVVSFTSKINDINRNIERCLKTLAKNNNSAFFAYIDVDNFKRSGDGLNDAFKVKTLATTIIYFKKMEIYRITGNDTMAITKCVMDAHAKTMHVTESNIATPPISHPEVPPCAPIVNILKQLDDAKNKKCDDENKK